MVDLDLQKLSAPIEALRPSLTEAYQRLDAKWEEIAQCLKILPIPCTVSHTYAYYGQHHEDYACLVWKKWNGKKRVCIETHSLDPNRPDLDYDVTTTPYEEWSAELRIEMLEHVPGLFEAAHRQTKQFIDKTKD